MLMDKYDNISDNEIRIIGSNPETGMTTPTPPKKKYKWWIIAIVFVILLFALGMLFKLAPKHGEEKPQEISHTSKSGLYAEGAYVEIKDTIINNVSLHCFTPINAKPKLVMGVLKEIPQRYILGAMAADFGLYKGEYQVAGAFVYQGRMLSHSKSKYGFCAIIKDSIVIGNELSTAYFEKAIEEKGDFFRQHALVYNGVVVNSVISKNESLRRALCRLNDGRMCIIDTDMSVSLDAFSNALCQYGVADAIALMGSGAAVRWAVDQAGRRFIAGADEYDFPNVVNYIVWEGANNNQ